MIRSSTEDQMPETVFDPISNVLKWILLITAILSFVVIFWGTVKTYQQAPPLPQKFISASGTLIMTDTDIVDGKAGFQKADIMDFGSIYGMGSLFGEDFTALYLVKLGRKIEDNIANLKYNKPFASLSEGEQYVARKDMQRGLQQIDLSGETSIIPDEIAMSIVELREDIAKKILEHDPVRGWTKAYGLNEKSALQVADFLIYSSLTTIAHRPGKNYSYTNNWPYEPTMGTVPTSDTFYWTWISFCFVFFGFGVILYIYHRYLNGPDHAPLTPVLLKFSELTESQRKIAKYFIVVSIVLLIQISVGVVLAHYYTERSGFYGININGFMPFNFLRDVHTQTPLVWIALAWISSAIFLTPIMSGKEAKNQGFYVDLLFWVTLLVVGGALIGNYLGIMGIINTGWFWFGNQGLSYLQLGRLWQIGFCLGLFLWSFVVFRGMWPSLSRLKTATVEFWTGRIKLEHLFWASTVNIAVLYCFGMIPLTGIEKSFTITDFWRWWVVHLWVEQSFEFFAICATAYMLMGVGLVSRLLAERTIFFEAILIFLGGVIGTGHHWYWTGGPEMWVPLGSMFSFIEVLPLALLIINAIQEQQRIKQDKGFKYNLAYLYILGSAFWNFVGAGVFGGGTLNAPLVNYYEHGTFLTLNHAHTSLFGAFGLLGLGMVYFCMRYAAGDKYQWDEKLGTWAFWLYNWGLILWVLLHFFPIGWPQLQAVYEHGVAYARSVEFYNTTLIWQWLRVPGDVLFGIAALLMAYDFMNKIRIFQQNPDRIYNDSVVSAR